MLSEAASQLCKALSNEDPRSVQSLLYQGANPNFILEKGVAAVHLAVGKESEKGIRCLKLILQHGADPNLRSSEELTPLHIAALWGCYQNLKLLLKNGGNPNLKDQDGNKAGDLAEQQDNRRCALLLSEHESQAAQAEVEDFPKFQYSVYSGQAGRDRSYCSAVDEYSITSHGMSMLSDFGEEALSSTRRSSSLNFSGVSGRPSCRGANRLELSEVSELSGPQDSVWDFEPPPVLSSTRVSFAGIRDHSVLPVLQEDVAFTDRRTLHYEHVGHRATDALPPPHPSAGSSRRDSRKSVSFKDVDEYFPVFDAESPRQRPTQESSESCDSTVDFSDYSEFFNSERMATVLHHQGIDVTSPDHVFVFYRDDASTDFEKTVLGCWPTEQETQNAVFTDSDPKSQAHPPSSSGGSSSENSQYSSCDSEEYKSAIGVSLFQKDGSSVEDVCGSTEEEKCSLKCTATELQSERVSLHNGADCFQPKTPSNRQAGLDVPKSETDSRQVRHGACVGAESTAPVAEITEMMSNLPFGRKMSKCELFSPRGKELQSGDCDMVASPFVTGRTRSRLSRCSQRTSQSSSSLSSLSLFEVSLPTPTRMCRPTRSQDSPADLKHTVGDVYCASPFPGGRYGGTLNSGYSQSQTETLRADQYSASYDGLSQADTVILSDSMADTFILAKTTSEKVTPHPFGITKGDALAADLGKEEVANGDEFITDDLSSSIENGSDWRMGSLSLSQTATRKGNKKSVEDSWITDVESQTSSLASVCTPQNPPDTSGTGCTPRYSMSRLSGHCRPQSLANLSYTPGGRPHLVDVDEPVEYLYTDEEEGHELIETHVPPTANTSISSNISSTTCDETVLYDWRSYKMSPSKGKENVEPDDDKEFKGLTDKVLRKKLVELGEAPGPITNRTRPVYIERLRRLQQETTSQPQSVQCNTDFSPELRRALHTFILPNSKFDEHILCEQFDRPDQNKKWREGVIKSSFNYLLLDPRVTNNLPFRSQSMTPKECFQTFVSAIFYVGKGKRSRPYSHMYEALDYYRGDKTSKKLCSKVKHILAVWNAERGVISLHCFQNVIPVEAYTREACMVDAIGVKMLTNQKRGDYYGVVSTWAAKRKRELGVHLLYRAMQIFLAEGERQLRPADIRVGH
ncbi:ankyrin repeat and LEM domain-containing protein 1 [Clupea harengus]|uniref:Ankyrin repeat and LEM domain-containing protein 1 n=1 Tax=Clupea harengus TaxID=7950 RepID=A0A6P3VXD3_CLUHA|nr:ankyrin repeat and LEM domain-containing protein 1 [Clupea harengus]